MSHGGAWRHRHATKLHALKVGDIVRRSDGASRNRYVIIDIRTPWIYTQRISGSGGPGIVTFPTQYMLERVT